MVIFTLLWAYLCISRIQREGGSGEEGGSRSVERGYNFLGFFVGVERVHEHKRNVTHVFSIHVL